MIFANPVRGQITPYPKNAPAGVFQVTQPFGAGKVASAVGEPPLDGKPFHRGIDLGNERCGASVLAMHSGVVKFAGKLRNGERLVIVNHHDGWGSSYGHLARIVVARGDRVDTSDKIGDVGDSGFAAGCHLHAAVKDKLPTGWSYLDFIPTPLGGRGDNPGRGRWIDPWPQLEQNVTVRPQPLDGIRIRNAATTDGEPFAETSGGRIVRAADGVDLGDAGAWRDWGGKVTGGKYPTGSGTSRSWERMQLDGEFRFIASAFAQRSAY